MGKGILLLMTAALIGGSVALLQSNRTSIETTDRQVARQELLLAREAARTGHNYIRSLAREVEAEMSKNGTKKISVADLVTTVNGAGGFLTAAYKGGTYKAWLDLASPSTYIANVEGRFGEASHFIGRHLLTSNTLLVPAPGFNFNFGGSSMLVSSDTKFELKVQFIESMAGYCSAIYLERWVPKGNSGHGNNVDGVDSSNPGGSKTGQDTDSSIDDEQKVNGSKKLEALEPELIFASGNNRDGTDALYEGELAPGTLMNFILAVDQGCDLAGQDVPITDSGYDYLHPALLVKTGRLEDMQEGKYAMLENHPSKDGVWRIAFEDLKSFSDAQHDDIKKNSYGNATWSKVNGKYTYGGNGWTNRDATGYYDLKDYGGIPDFSDQVFEIELTPKTTTTTSTVPTP